MRQSLAALAIIERPGTPPRWLVQWNERWQVYSLVGGHKHPDESFRDCLRREVIEELGLREDTQFRVGLQPVVRLRYRANSDRAQEETDYTHEAYLVELLGEAQAAISTNPNNRWVTREEIAGGRADDSRPISDQVRRIADGIAALDRSTLRFSTS